MNVIRDAIYGMGIFELIFFLISGGFVPFLLWFFGIDQLKIDSESRPRLDLHSNYNLQDKT